MEVYNCLCREENAGDNDNALYSYYDLLSKDYEAHKNDIKTGIIHANYTSRDYLYAGDNLIFLDSNYYILEDQYGIFQRQLDAGEDWEEDIMRF